MHSNFSLQSEDTLAMELQRSSANYNEGFDSMPLYQGMASSGGGESKSRWRRALTSVYGQRIHGQKETSAMSDDESQRTQSSSSGRGFVQHNYHDHAKDPVYIESPASTSSLQSFGSVDSEDSNGRAAAVTRFPERLTEMLSKMDEDGTSHIVSWQPHGRCFVVHKPKDFVDKVMPKYFRQSKMTSFQRQLNLYGFARLTVGADRGGYYHELFLRGRPDLCKRIVRMRIKGTGIKPAYSPDTEPKFYAMTPCMESEENASPVEPEDVMPCATQQSSLDFSVENDIEPIVVPSYSESLAPFPRHFSSRLFEELGTFSRRSSLASRRSSLAFSRRFSLSTTSICDPSEFCTDAFDELDIKLFADIQHDDNLDSALLNILASGSLLSESHIHASRVGSSAMV